MKRTTLRFQSFSTRTLNIKSWCSEGWFRKFSTLSNILGLKEELKLNLSGGLSTPSMVHLPTKCPLKMEGLGVAGSWLNTYLKGGMLPESCKESLQTNNNLHSPSVETAPQASKGNEVRRTQELCLDLAAVAQLVTLVPHMQPTFSWWATLEDSGMTTQHWPQLAVAGAPFQVSVCSPSSGPSTCHSLI